VFKAEDPDARVPGGPEEIGIEAGDPGFARRNLATRKAAENLGLGHLIPDCELVVTNGQVGIAMELAPGSSLEKDEEVEFTGVASDDDVRRFNLRRDPATGKVFTTRRVATPINLEGDPDVDVQYQKHMTDLQWLDAMCGQIDRHERNYLIDVQNGAVTVKGIDNDFCFGKKHTSVEGIEGAGAPQNLGQQFCGLPILIDGALYDRIQGLTVDAMLGAAGKKLLDPAEVAAAAARLAELQAHAGQLDHDGCVVRDWKAWRSPTDLSAKDFLLGSPKQSYYKRDIRVNRNNGG